MRKTLLALGVLGMALVLSGCGQPAANQQNTFSDQGQPTVPGVQKDNSIISSIKDAMGLGKQMKCSYSTTINGSTLESVAYIEGNKYKSTATINGKNTNTLFDGDTMYTWMDGQITGTKMAMSCINDLKTSLPQGQPAAPGVQSPNDQFNNATNVSCTSTTGIDFSVPANINFTDQCEMLKKTLDMTKNLKANIPANVPNAPNMPKL